MANLPTASPTQFTHCFADFQSNPTSFRAPTDHDQTVALLDQTKVAINEHLARGDLKTGEQLVDFAWAIANQSNRREETALAHWCEALLLSNRDIHGTLTHFGEALNYYRETGRREEQGRILIGYAHHLNLLGRIDNAQAAITQAIESLQSMPHYRDWPIAYLNAAAIHGQAGDYRAMWQSATASEAKAHELSAVNPERAEYYDFLRGNAQINQGLAALALAEFDAAAESLTNGLQIAEQHGALELSGRAALNLGRLETYRGRLFAALQWLAQAREAFTNAQIEIDQATVALEEALLYARLLMSDRARRAALDAAQAFAKVGIVPEGVEANLVAAQISIDREEPQRALRILHKIADSVPHAPPVLRQRYAGYRAHPLFAQTESEREAARRQAESAQRALNALGAKAEAIEVGLIVARLAGDLRADATPQSYESLAQQARDHELPLLEYQALFDLAAHQSARDRCTTLRRAADLIVAVRQQMQPEELKANLLAGYLPVYKALIAAQLLADRPLDAAATLLEAKAGLWHDLAQAPAIAPPSQAWTEARATLTQWQQELRWANEDDAAEPEFFARCEQQITAAEEALATAARLNPTQRVPTQRTQPLPTIQAVQQQIAADSCVLEFMVDSEYINLCIIQAEASPTLSPTPSPTWHRLAETQTVQRLVGRLNLLLITMCNAPKTDDARQQIAHAQQTAIDTLLAKLHACLIQPIQDQIAPHANIIVVPDDFLFELPWGALFDGTHYWGERQTLSLVPSSALLAMQSAHAAPDKSVIENPLLLGYAGTPPLAHLDAELNAVAAAFSSVTRIDPAASTDLMQADAPPILHIAAHGRINRQSPLLSSLEFCDGQLLLAEVLNLNLHGTNLVTLSACQTGAIPEKGGVLLALAGAFLCVGANHVLASLWPVDDRATTLFMQEFYTHLQQHQRPAPALRHAQHALRDAGYRHPFYWAAFQLLGGFADAQ